MDVPATAGYKITTFNATKPMSVLKNVSLEVGWELFYICLDDAYVLQWSVVAVGFYDVHALYDL